MRRQRNLSRLCFSKACAEEVLWSVPCLLNCFFHGWELKSEPEFRLKFQ